MKICQYLYSILIREESFCEKNCQKGSVAYVALIIVLVIVASFLILNIIPKPNNFKGDNPLCKTGNLPLLVAHRGGDGQFPGNTLEAFYNAYGVDERVVMETDINITKDGVLILCHEASLDKISSAWKLSKAVRLDLVQLKKRSVLQQNMTRGIE